MSVRHTQTPHGVGNAPSGNNKWSEPETDKTGESLTMCNGNTAKIFRNIDKQEEKIALIALVSISFWSQLVIKQTYNEKQNSWWGGGGANHQQYVVHTFSPGRHVYVCLWLF